MNQIEIALTEEQIEQMKNLSKGQRRRLRFALNI